MRKTIFIAAFNALLAGLIFTSCESKQEKVEDAREDVQEAKEDLKEAQRELNAEYPGYKTDAEARIEANNKRIAELKAKLRQPGEKPLDDERRKRIEELEQRNAQLRSRLYDYETTRSDWEEFKREFNRDMDEIKRDVDNL
jgi:F0F1-type ATP synthase membrane subunit b/b'